MSKTSKTTTAPNQPAAPASEAPIESTAEVVTETSAEGASTPATAPQAEPSVAPEGAPSQVALATVQAAGLDKPAPESLDTPFDPYAADAIPRLVKLFPEEARYLKQVFRPVTDDELEAAVAALPENLARNFGEALERMNPVKLGDHGRKRSGFQMFEARIYHGTGDDPTRPKLTPTGGIYSTDGKILAACDRDSASALKVPERFEGFVISGYEVNTFWPPRGGDDDAKGDKKDAKEGDENKSKAPICRSIDQIMGDKYGACAACPERPFKDNQVNKNACRNEVHIYFVPRDFSGIYRMVFNGTNTKPGRAIRKSYSSGWRTIWDHPFALTTKKEVDPKDSSRRWFLAQSDVMRSDAPTEEEAKFLNVISRKIDSEYYWIERRRIHLKVLTAGAEKPSGEADLGALMGGSGDAPAASGAPLQNLANLDV